MIILANVIVETTEKAKDFWNKQGKKRKTTILVAAGVIVLAVALLVFSLTRTDFAVLYTNLDSSEAGEIYSILQDQGVNAKVQGDSTILVPKKNVEEIRISLNSQGYPSTGLNYDIFENASSLGSTDMEKNVYLKFQLEQNIAQTIKRLDKIQGATVMVTLQTDSQFALSGSGGTAAAASVVLDVASGNVLSAAEAEAIRNLVMRSVPNLSSENISIVDSNLNMYDAQGDDLAATTTSQMELEEATRNKLETQVTNLLTPVFGNGKVKASVNVKLNFDKKVTSSVTFEPPIEGEEQGLIVSLQEMEERITGGTSADGVVGYDANGLPIYPEDTATTSDGDYVKTTREFNAEVNETKEQIESAQGTIEELSISVIIDGDDSVDEMLTDVQDLVAKAIGVEDQNIKVLNTSFRATQELEEELEEANKLAGRQTRNQWIKNILIILAVLGGLAAVFFIMRKRMQDEKASELTTRRPQGAAGGVEFFADEDIDIADLTNSDTENTSKVKKLIQSNPEAVAQLLRNWLSDDYRG